MLFRIESVVESVQRGREILRRGWIFTHSSFRVNCDSHSTLDWRYRRTISSSASPPILNSSGEIRWSDVITYHLWILARPSRKTSVIWEWGMSAPEFGATCRHPSLQRYWLLPSGGIDAKIRSAQRDIPWTIRTSWDGWRSNKPFSVSRTSGPRWIDPPTQNHRWAASWWNYHQVLRTQPANHIHIGRQSALRLAVGWRVQSVATQPPGWMGKEWHHCAPSASYQR